MIEILKGKSIDEIRELVNSDEEFMNKDFLKVVLKFNPNEFEMAVNTISFCNIGAPIFKLITLISNGKMFQIDSLMELKSIIYCLDLCGISGSMIEFVNNTKDDKKDYKNIKDNEKIYITLSKNLKHKIV